MMGATTVKFYSLKYNRIKTYWVAALFVAGNIVLPQLCHLVPQGGMRWLPIYFFTLVGAYKYGWRVGVLTAVLSPLVNSALFGIAAGYAASHFKRASVGLLAAVVLAYQIVGTLGEWAIVGDFALALQDFRIGLPGMALQIVGGWFFINRLIRR